MAEREPHGARTKAREAEPQQGPVVPPHTESHGHSLAAWVGVGTVMLGSLVGCLAVVFTVWWLLAVGLVVALLGPLLGMLLARMGYGAAPAEESHQNDAQPHHGTR